jgi:peptide deformylase
VTPRPFLLWPDPRLRQRAAPVGTVDAGVRALWDEMLAAMYAMPGVGLAAPQLGVMRRLAVVDASPGRDRPVRLADPRIVEAATELRAGPEASPNLPGLVAEVRRPAWVRVAYLDADGAPAERRFEGLWAASVQHQIDHLDGRVFLDRLGPVKREMLLRAFARRRARG